MGYFTDIAEQIKEQQKIMTTDNTSNPFYTSPGWRDSTYPGRGFVYPAPPTTIPIAPPIDPLYSGGSQKAPDKPKNDKDYLPVLERIATALEAIVERFC